MANVRRFGAYGAFMGIAAVVAIIMFVRGSPLGILVLLAGVFMLLLYHVVLREKLPKVEALLEGEGKLLSLDDIRKRFAALSNREDEAAAEEEKKRESRLLGAVELVKKTVGDLVTTAKKEETVGGIVDAIKAKEPAADKSLDVLTVEATAMLKIHARSAGRLKEKSTVISEIAK
ncbi:hypothetical protein KY359_00930, partial [Candidatus Woesearchaeota archaeon]|nr:hypothetical protein [Candidatus Woesearchaeota archaeon]